MPFVALGDYLVKTGSFAHEIILDGASLMTAADVLVEALMDWGVDTVFGLPGDGINGIMEALRVRQDKGRFIQVRHEESADSWLAAMQSSQGGLGCAWRPLARAAFIC
jgi:hypothetical protein